MLKESHRQSRHPDSTGTQTAINLIFLVEYPLSKRDYDRFGIDVLRLSGFHVEVWDLSHVLRSHVVEQIKIVDPVAFSECRQFSRRTDVVATVLAMGRPCIVICMIEYTPASLFIFRALAKAGIPYVVHANNPIPLPKRTAQYLAPRRAVSAMFRKLALWRLVHSAVGRLPCDWLGVRSAALLVAGGQRSVDHRTPITRTSPVLWLHAWDYDIYLSARAAQSAVNDRLGVFLDEFYPYHPDFGYERTSAPVAAEQYYPLLRNFFDFLEQRWNVRIAVAAHPRSHYEFLPDFYGSRDVVRGRTAELVKNARFVLAHSSTSINFAVLFRKPVIFVTCNRLRGWYGGAYIDTFASLLGKRPALLEHPEEVAFEQELAVDERAYSAYQREYIKTEGTPELPSWQQLAEHLKRLSGAGGAEPTAAVGTNRSTPDVGDLISVRSTREA